MEKQKIQNSQNYIEEEQSQGLTLSDLKTHYKATESGECVLALLGSRPCKLHSPQPGQAPHPETGWANHKAVLLHYNPQGILLHGQRPP